MRFFALISLFVRVWGENQGEPIFLFILNRMMLLDQNVSLIRPVENSTLPYYFYSKQSLGGCRRVLYAMRAGGKGA
jgi:hypothetical protein